MNKLYFKRYFLIIVSLILIPTYIQGQNGWTKKANLPTPRVGASACVYNNKIYVIGGMHGSYIDLAVNEVYDPSTNSWNTLAPMPTARSYLLTAAVNDTIYAIGGGYPITTNKVEAYNPLVNRWTTKANMPYPWRGVYGDAVNEKIYSVGGNYNGRNCFEYNAARNEWIEKTSIPDGHCVGPLSATVYKGLIYTFGGTIAYTGSYPNPALSDVCAYNPQTDTWDTSFTHMPTPRYTLRTFLVNGKIYAIGGSQAEYTSLATVEVYDPATDTWDKLPDMPEPLAWFTGAVVNNKIYLFGGTPDWVSGGTDVWEYDPSVAVAVEPVSIAGISSYQLEQNYPNPFNPSTKIKYSIPQLSNVIIKVFDVLGNEVATLVNEEKPVGTYELNWDASNVPSGVYFYQLKAGNFMQAKKMMLLK